MNLKAFMTNLKEKQGIFVAKYNPLLITASNA